MKDKISIENYYEEKSNELNVKNDKCILNNIMFKQNIINGDTLDLAFIFDNFELNESVLFAKLNSETYKIYTKNDIVDYNLFKEELEKGKSKITNTLNFVINIKSNKSIKNKNNN